MSTHDTSKEGTDQLLVDLKDAAKATELPLERSLGDPAYLAAAQTGIRAHGERITPDSAKYIGSVCAHIYSIREGTEVLIVPYTEGLTSVSGRIARDTCAEITRNTMRVYGVDPPKRTDDKLVKGHGNGA